MDIQVLTQYFLQYGAVFIFVIILLEYMNLPGFPAGIIMPLAGIWAARGQISFFMAFIFGWRTPGWAGTCFWTAIWNVSPNMNQSSGKILT